MYGSKIIENDPYVLEAHSLPQDYEGVSSLWEPLLLNFVERLQDTAKS